MKKYLLISAILLQIVTLKAQVVSTLTTDSLIREGLHVDDAGDIYTTSGGLVGGTSIGKYEVATDNYIPIFNSSLFGTIDVDQTQDGTLIITNFDNSTVTALDPVTGIATVIATAADGLDAP